MAQISTEDYNGDCRRTKGKLKLSIGEWLRIFTIIGTIFVAGIGFYIKTNMGLKALAKEAEASTDTNKKQDDSIIILQTQVENIDTNVERIMTRQESMEQLLYRIDGKLEAKDD